MNYLNALMSPVPSFDSKKVESLETIGLQGDCLKIEQTKELAVNELNGQRRLKNFDESLVDEAMVARFEEELNCAERPDPSIFYKRYQGQINPAFKGSQYVLVQDVAKKILFSQKNVSNYTQGIYLNYLISDLAGKMFRKFNRTNEWKDDGVLDVVHIGNGMFTSLDNRRLLIAKKIAQHDRKYGIWVRSHEFEDELSTSQLKKRFNAETWGEALDVRVSTVGKFGFSRYPTIVTSKIQGRVKDTSQKILIDVNGCRLSQLHPEDVNAIRGKLIRGELAV